MSEEKRSRMEFEGTVIDSNKGKFKVKLMITIPCFAR